MGYYAVRSRVLFHDTMAYGSHHFLTNFKFQCEAREELLFRELLTQPGESGTIQDLLFLTQEAYSRNLAPVHAGETVSVLLTVEEPKNSSVRFCFRVIRSDGTPVACGFQSVVCTSASDKAIRHAPVEFWRHLDKVLEELVDPNFAERVVSGRTSAIFGDAVVRLGAAVAEGQTPPGFVAGITSDNHSGLRANTVAGSVRKPQAVASPRHDHIVVVGMGCVLPGADNPIELWNNVKNGVDSIGDLRKLFPHYETDFFAPGIPKPDKTYSLLSGLLTDEFVRHRGNGPFADCIAQRMFAEACNQCLSDLRRSPTPSRTSLYVGSTADGSLESEEMLVRNRLLKLAAEVSLSDGASLELVSRLKALFPKVTHSGSTPTSSEDWHAVATHLLGRGATVVAVDAACASSLYSISLGVNALIDGRCDVAICGGVFSPGPASMCLFSQFRGLSATGSRPFDDAADGVVFSPGAAFVVLERLSDALDHQDPIHAVIRGVGLSSDGKSASVTEPKRLGQEIAVRRAYHSAGINPPSVDYVEAHATSTPVGDAVEFEALKEVFGKSKRQVCLSSIKALIGHTGWAAGAASVIKACAALNDGTIPAQANFETPNRSISLENSGFSVLHKPRPWNQADGPRRAGVSGFGFGGTNAHVVLEAFDEAHHRVTVSEKQRMSQPLVLVGVGELFPWDKLGSGKLHFDIRELTLPSGTRLLPEALREMDKTQLLAVNAAERALSTVGEWWPQHRAEIGVVLGFAGKTPRGIEVNARIYADFVRRRLESMNCGVPNDGCNLDQRIISELRKTPPSNAYTLPGIMPNVIAGRVANLFDLHGPNLVVDVGECSIPEAFEIAESMIRHDQAKLVLVGAVSAGSQHEARSGSPNIADAAFVMALVSPQTASQEKLSAMASLQFSLNSSEPVVVPHITRNLMAATGSVELAHALDEARSKGQPHSVCWRASSGVGRTITCSNGGIRAEAQLPRVPLLIREQNAATDVPSDIQVCAPALSPMKVEVVGDSRCLDRRRAILLVDDSNMLALFRGKQNLCITPARAKVPDSICLDLSTDETIERQLQAIDFGASDLILAVKDLAVSDRDEAFTESSDGQGFVDLLFAVVRHRYADLSNKRLVLRCLVLNAWKKNRLLPYTGLLSGMIKSLCRELPGSDCRLVLTDEPPGLGALGQLFSEIACSKAWPEVIYRKGQRSRFVLQSTSYSGSSCTPDLGREAVVLTTGGGTGITAVLAEALAERSKCNLFLLGRTALDGIPHELVSMSDAEVSRFEQKFYLEEKARTPGVTLRALRERFSKIKKSREIRRTLERLRLVAHAATYLQVDVANRSEVESAIKGIVDEFGRIDLVVHGAAVQHSRLVPKKSIDEFREAIRIKVAGAYNIRDACALFLPSWATKYHLVSSSFSFFGNDAQIDYGAANETLNRMADYFDDYGGCWSSLAWLGWAGVGMTSGSEYAELARSRGLRPVTRSEGKSIFSKACGNTGLPGSSVLISGGESRFYGITVVKSGTQEPVEPQTSSDRSCRERNLDLSASLDWFVASHMVRNIPTVPGSMLVEFAARAAASSLISPDKTIFVDDARFLRFVTVRQSQQLRLRTSMKYSYGSYSAVLVEAYSDFVHRSGTVLRQSDPNYQALVRFSGEFDRESVLPKGRVASQEKSMELADPYTAPESPVRLSGAFDCLREIKVFPSRQTARFHLNSEALIVSRRLSTPAILIDAMCRIAMLRTDSDNETPIYVPMKCGRAIFRLRTDQQDERLADSECLIVASAPIARGPISYCDVVEALDQDGKVIVRLQRLVAQRIGEVSRASRRSVSASGVSG